MKINSDYLDNIDKSVNFKDLCPGSIFCVDYNLKNLFLKIELDQDNKYNAISLPNCFLLHIRDYLKVLPLEGELNINKISTVLLNK